MTNDTPKEVASAVDHDLAAAIGLLFRARGSESAFVAGHLVRLAEHRIAMAKAEILKAAPHTEDSDCAVDPATGCCGVCGRRSLG